MTSTVSLRDHVQAAILDAAAAVLSEKGEGASMGDVAEGAGVARATLYRYFPTREHLLRALGSAALDDAHHRLMEADLDAVAVPEALARMARALVACSSRYSVLARDQTHVDSDEIESRLGAPIRAVFVRGCADGALRADIAAEVLVELFGGLVRAAVQMNLAGSLGVEQASAAVVTVFLEGAGTGGSARGQGAPAPGGGSN